MRMPSVKVLNQSDARPWHFQELLKSTGCWRLAIFAGNILSTPQKEKIWTLGGKLAAPDSFIRRYTPATAESISSTIEVLAVHSASRTQVDIFDFPPIFRPFSETAGFDYGKVFVDDESYHEGHGQAYEAYGIDAERGCAVAIRPDQYIGWIGEVDDYDMMERYFGGFMKGRGDGGMRADVDVGDVLKFAGSGGSDAERAERDSSVLGAL